MSLRARLIVRNASHLSLPGFVEHSAKPCFLMRLAKSDRRIAVFPYAPLSSGDF